MKKSIALILATAAVCLQAFAQTTFRTNVSTFDRIPLKTESAYYGNDLKGGFWNGHFYFRNQYDTGFKSWSGFSVSNTTDTVKADYTNEFSSITKGGICGTKNYAVCYGAGTVISEKAGPLTGFYATNTTLTYKTLKKGSAFSKKFGGASGNDPDWFGIKIYNYSGGAKQDSVFFYLADFRSTNDYIVNDWTWFDLSGFKNTDSLIIRFEGSDMGSFGLNTPAYVCIDDFNFNGTRIGHGNELKIGKEIFKGSKTVWNGESDTSGGFAIGGLYFENTFDNQYKSWAGWALSCDFDTTKTGFDAQYVVKSGKDADLDSGFAVSYGHSVLRLPYDRKFIGYEVFRFKINNSLLAYNDMKNGSPFSKKFGGATGFDRDTFKLTIKGIGKDGISHIQRSVFLSDFRMERKMILKDWVEVWLPVNGAVQFEFSLESSDNGSFGMNTPAYFCMDRAEWIVEDIDKLERKNLSVYPNPAQDFIHLDIAQADELIISDMTGKVVHSIENASTNRINVSTLNPGMYFLTAKSDHALYLSKFIKL